ncbi:MAG: site-specific integrase [Actinomycetota bacterium]|nr:site-specific integrase [Actinomycetota bacterium]
MDEYLAYLADRNYSPKTVRAYGYDLLAFCRWLVVEEQPLQEVTTEALLRFLRACRNAKRFRADRGRTSSGCRAVGWISTPSRRSIGDWLRSRVCSRSPRCGIRT